MNRQVEVDGHPQMMTEQVKIKGITVREQLRRNFGFRIREEPDLMSQLVAFEKNEITEQLRGHGTSVLEQVMAEDPELADVMRSEQATVSLKEIIADWQQRVGIPHWNVRVTITDPEFDTEWELMNE